MNSQAAFIVAEETIQAKIFIIRGKKVMLDQDLAMLYGVKTKTLNQAVKRNIERFPEDFIFQLNIKEAQSSRSQFVTLKRGHNIKYLPYAFTEHGILMLSSVLKSERAIQVNIQIMRTFVKLRELMLLHKDLAQRIDALERKFNEHDKNFIIVFDAIKKLLQPPEKPKSPIGFHP